MATKTQIAKGQAAKGKSIKQWAEEINAAYQKAAASILEVGNLLRAAQRALGAGGWKKLVDSTDLLKFDAVTASKFRQIADHDALAKHVKLLPPSYSTLYTLAQLQEKNFLKAVKKGDIHPNMTRADAEEVVEKLQPKPEPKEEYEEEPEESNEPAPRSKGSKVSREAEDAEHEPTPRGKASQPKPSVKAKEGIEGALDNLQEAVESLDYWCDLVETKMDDDEVKKVPAGLAKKVEALCERLLDLSEKLAA